MVGRFTWLRAGTVLCSCSTSPRQNIIFCGVEEEVGFPVNLQLPLVEIPHCSLLSKPIQYDDDLSYVLGDVTGHFQRTAVQICWNRHFPDYRDGGSVGCG